MTATVPAPVAELRAALDAAGYDFTSAQLLYTDHPAVDFVQAWVRFGLPFVDVEPPEGDPESNFIEAEEAVWELMTDNGWLPTEYRHDHVACAYKAKPGIEPAEAARVAEELYARVSGRTPEGLFSATDADVPVGTRVQLEWSANVRYRASFDVAELRELLSGEGRYLNEEGRLVLARISGGPVNETMTALLQRLECESLPVESEDMHAYVTSHVLQYPEG